MDKTGNAPDTHETRMVGQGVPFERIRRIALLSMPADALLQRSRPAPAFGQHEVWPIPSPMTHRTVPCSGLRTGRN